MMLELIIIIIIVWAIVRGRKKRHGQTENTKKSMPKPSPVNQARQAAKAAGRTREETKVHKAAAGKYSTPRSDLRNGIRHEEWQPVPNGYTIRRCVYCAAENAIPANDDPKKYRCYFCHVQL